MSEYVNPIGLYPMEPTVGGWANQDEWDDFLRWAVDLGVSDIKITPTNPIALSLHGKWHFVTKRPMDKGEGAYLLNKCSGKENTYARVDAGKNENFSYEIFKEKGERRSGVWRFRGNATSAMMKRDKGYAMTFRTIPDELPSLDNLGVERELIEALTPDNGIISLSGVMGSGKTTTLAGLIREIATTTHKSIMTLEKPIEFDYTNIPGALGPMEQLEVPRMIDSFKEGIESSTRKAVNVLLVGETNDRDTMEACIHAGEIGIAVYHTLHTQDVPSIPARIFHQFSHEEAPAIAVSYLSACRVMMQQRLAPRVGGGRVALREWLVLDDQMRQRLIATDMDRIQSELEKMLREYGRPLIESARQAYNDGLIEKDYLNRIEREKQ